MHLFTHAVWDSAKAIPIKLKTTLFLRQKTTPEPRQRYFRIIAHGRNSPDLGVLLCQPAWLFFCGLSWLPLGRCLFEHRTPHGTRKNVDPGVPLSLSAEVALRIARAGSRSVSLCSAFPAALTPMRATTLGDQMPEA